MHSREEQLQAFDRLLTVMDELREKCPWDRKQTFDSLRQNTIEETYELATAIVKQDMNEIAKELGDVLLHVVFYAKLGSEDKWNFSDSAPQEPHDRFDIADVCNRLCDKLIFRHPHVYGPEAAQNAEEVSRLWEQVKLKEKGGNKTVLEGIPDSLPTLVKAYRIQDKAANAGFDWEKKEDVWEKVKEEIAELEQAMRSMPDNPEPRTEEKIVRPEGDKNPEPKTENREPRTQNAIEEEMGDVLFSLINVARLYKVRPDNALEKTNLKFISRFNYIEQKAREQGRQVTDLTLDEMEALWQEAKFADLANLA